MTLTQQPTDSTDPQPALDNAPQSQKTTPNQELATWVMEKVNRWRESRDTNHGDHWERYYRIWRGKWDPSLKGKLAERSRIITPATQSAVDQTVAEMAEAVFGRGMWFDLSDPPPAPPATPPVPGQPTPPPHPDYVSIEETIRDNLIQDFADSRLTADVIESFYNGALFGTGIAKRVIDTRLDGTKFVAWEPVNPDGFVIDTAATTVDEALGCAHETIRPMHEVKLRQESGEYFDEEIGSASGFGATNALKGSLTDMLDVDPQDGVYITEYHGNVPSKYMPKAEAADKPDVSEVQDADLMEDDGNDGDEDEGPEYIEAVVVIGNGTHLLKAEQNHLNDRGFIAYQHHRAPNSFWGIGVVEKAFNAQSGLDGEVRARQDALGLTTYPVVGVDATRMPRNLQMVISPGKVYLTNGRPSEIIEPISFGSLNNASFQQSGDMERYVQVATGANDPAKPVNGNSTASGQSQQSSAFIKRAKLTMQSVDVDFLSPLIRKSILAYNVLNPHRYPKLPQFTVNSTMSIMAREFEQMQMTNLLAIIPQQSPAFPIILKGIIQNYSGPQKDQIIEAIDKSMQPDPAQVQQTNQMNTLALSKADAEVKKLQAEIQEITERAGLSKAKAGETTVKTQLAPMQMQIEAHQAATAAKGADTQARNVEVTAAGMQIDHHHKTLGHVHEKVRNAIALAAANKPVAAPSAGA